MGSPTSYVELHCHSAFSFLDGASHPEELVARAAELGYPALALTDHDGVYGSLEFAHAAKHAGIRPITGAEVTLERGMHVTLLCESGSGYANLCRIITAAHAGTRHPGREDREPLPPSVPLETVAELSEGLVCLSGCVRDGLALHDQHGAARLAAAFGPERFFVELQRPYERGDARRHTTLRDLAEHLGVETVATGNVHAHTPRRTLLQDVLVAIRCRTSLDGCERERRGNREAVLRPPAEMVERFTGIDRAAAERTLRIAERLAFDLTEELGYRYPDFSDRADPAIRQLHAICAHAFGERYGASNRLLQANARTRLEGELALIEELGLAGFFLLHHEVLELARECALEVRGRDSPRMFLPPGRGRGSSVGSIVCYLTGLSHVDPVENGLSLGRFLNRELVSVPDIDLDFPRDIREKLIVRVTERYGHEHAALVASFATYRSRGAIRDVGKALGLPHAELERLARVTDGWHAERVADEVASLPDAEQKLLSKRWRAFRFLTGEIAGLPRHASQHPGGMVISSRPLIELVPVQPAAMAGRQLCQWDKDSCADAGFLKIDLLGLGMLSCVEECVDRIARLHGAPIDLSRIPSRRPGGVRRDPGRRHRRGVPDREPRADAEPPPHPARDDRRPHDPGRARAARDRSRGRRCTRTSSTGGASARTRRSSSACRTSRCASRLPRPSASSSSRTRCWTSRSRSPGSRSGRRRRLRRAMSRKRSLAALEAHRVALRRGRGRERRLGGGRGRGLRHARRLLRASGSRRRTRPRSGCSRTSRRGCATTTRPSSSAGS